MSGGTKLLKGTKQIFFPPICFSSLLAFGKTMIFTGPGGCSPEDSAFPEAATGS